MRAAVSLSTFLIYTASQAVSARETNISQPLYLPLITRSISFPFGAVVRFS